VKTFYHQAIPFDITLNVTFLLDMMDNSKNVFGGKIISNSYIVLEILNDNSCMIYKAIY